MRRLCALGTVLALSGCATITRTETLTDTPIKPVEKRGTSPDSVIYVVKSDADGDRLKLAVEQSETCFITKTPRKRRTKHVARSADSKFLTTTWTLAGLAGLLGVGMYSDAQGIADDVNMDPTAEPTTPDEVRRTGIAVIGLGAAIAVIAIGNHLRAVDYEEDAGVFRGEPDRDEFTCNEMPTKKHDVTLLLADGTKKHGTTDDEGWIEFSLSDVPLAGLPHGTSKDDLFPGESTAQLLIDDTPVSIKLAQDDTEELAFAVMSDPASRASKDVLAQRQRACDKDVEQARGVDITEPEAVVRGWTAAKKNCGDLWTQQLDTEFGDTQTRIAAERCTSAFERANASLAADVSRVEVEAADADLRIAQKTCTNQMASKLQALSARLAKATKHVEDEEKSARRRAELQRHLGAVAAALRADKPEDAWELLYLEPELKTVASEEIKNLAWQSLDKAVEDVMAARPTRSEAETEMCFVRMVFTSVVGQSELRNAVQRFVGAVGTSDPAHASRVVSALKAGHCSKKPAAKKTVVQTQRSAPTDGNQLDLSDDEDDRTAPVTGEAPQSVPPTVLETYRIAGEKVIVPDDKTKTEIARSGRDRIVGSFKLCLDASGDVTSVTQLKSTGFNAYDAKINSTMRDWRYRPYLTNGRAVPVCTAVTFIYTEK